MGDLLEELERPLEVRVSDDGERDAMVAALTRAYDAMFVERDRRSAELNRIRSSLTAESGLPMDMVDAGLSSYLNEPEMASSILRALLSDAGKRALRLNEHCQIPYRDLHEEFVGPIEEAARGGSWCSRTRRMSEAELLQYASKNLPRLDIKGLVGALVSTYGGKAGEAFRLSQLAQKVFDDLSLERARFDIKAGKVELQVQIYGSREPKENYDTGVHESEILRFAEIISIIVSQSSKYEGAVLLNDVHAYRGHISPGMRIPVGKEAYVKTFQSHYRVVMTHAMADHLRAFIAEHRG